MRWLTALALLVGCGGGGGSGDDVPGDDQPPGDAKHLDAAIDITELSGDFTCAGVAWPATAPDPLSLIARVKDPVGPVNVGGAAVEIHKRSDDSVLVMGTAAGNGIFALNVITAGTAPAIYRKATLAGRLDGYTYDPYPPFDTNHPQRDIYTPTAANRDTYYAAAGITSDPAKSTVLVEIYDCLDLQVYGATIEAPGAAKIIYLDDSGAPSASQFSTGSPGIAVALNVPAGAVDITVHAGSVVYRAVPVTSRANSFIYAPRLP
jgi:hypothetical protein